MYKKLLLPLLIVVPLIFLVIGLRFDRTRYSTDPESAYLLNGINIAKLKPVGHYDNPGTTVQMYSAMVLRITHFFRSTGDDLETDVLLNSEYYIEVLRYSMIAVNALVLILLGVIAFVMFGNIWLALLLQVAPFLSVTLIEECFTKVSPEPVLFATVSVFALLLFRFYRSKDQYNRKYVLVFALITGFGLATKMTFLPMVLVPFIILHGWKTKIKYLLLIIPSFILFTLPAVTGYLNMAYWFLNLFTHTGSYGQGGSGIIDPAQYFNSILLIIKNNPELVTEIVFGSLVLALIKFRKKHNNNEEINRAQVILTAVLLAQVASIFLVAKHYQSNHYLFPALSLIGMVSVFLFLIAIKSVSGIAQRYIRFSLPVLFACMLGVSLLHKPFLTLAYKGYRLSNADTKVTEALIEREYKNYVKTYYYPTSFNQYSSLYWGNVYSRRSHTERLMQLFPQGLFFNAWEKSFQLWETNISPGEFISRYGGKILLIGGPKTDDEIRMVEEGGLRLKKITEGRLQVVYEVDTALSPLFKGNLNAGPPSWKLLNGFEEFSADKQWVMSEGQHFCKNSGLTSEKPRSGKFSFSLPAKDSYAMDYELTNVKPGLNYEISIWRFGGDENARLVVSAKNADSFYARSTGYIETDDKGWRKLNLVIKVPKEFKENRLKVYLWNQGNSPAWFDDIEIKQYQQF